MVFTKSIVLLILLISFLKVLSSTSNNNVSKPGCESQCGNVTIPYPFGFGSPDCFREGFEIICNGTGSSRKAFIAGSGSIYDYNFSTSYQISNISAGEQNQLTAFASLATQCYQQNETQTIEIVQFNNKAPYLFSSSSNKFTVLGCNTIAYITGYNDKGSPFAGVCVSYCPNQTSINNNGLCDGTGCCQTSIPRDVMGYRVFFDTSLNSSDIYDFSPCSYAFLGDQNWLHFNESDLSYDFDDKHNQTVPTVLNWAIRDYETCEEAKANESSYACVSSNSTCFNVTDSYGYVCNCSQGYSGNPYLPDGCQDINECLDPVKYPCSGTCSNTEGSYECKCKGGRDANKDGSCSPPNKFPTGAKLAIGISVGVMVTVVVFSFIVLACLKRKREKEKDMFFKQNGGLILFEQLRSKQVDTIGIFSKEELENATDNFSDSTIIGQGGHGMVYKGILEDNRVIAIKKSKVFDDDQKEEFVNEMIILSQINHRNVVKLLGCCLEVDVPILVYEFVSNGSLHHNLHDKNSVSPLNLSMRLRIATESAEALAHLHSSINRSIVHGDVKSHNILLDDKFTAKVSDFGASQLVPLDEADFLSFIQGTLGYLDPECLQTHQLTDKSDVYSFGVLLVELITGKMAIFTDDSGQKKNLSSLFIEKMKENKLGDILDAQIIDAGNMELIQEVAEIAKYCLIVIGEERPTMRDVAERLRSLINRSKNHPWMHNDSKELEGLLWESRANNAEESETGTMELNSVQIGMAFDIEDGR